MQQKGGLFRRGYHVTLNKLLNISAGLPRSFRADLACVAAGLETDTLAKRTQTDPKHLYTHTFTSV